MPTVTEIDGTVRTLPEPRPSVYMAGPIDYIEHRSPGRHLTDNWRHRYFAGMEVDILCPVCINRDEDDPLVVMDNNRRAIRDASLFIGHFPGDLPTFGTPVEIYEWAVNSFARSVDPGCLIHPSRPGVFVRWLELRHGLTLVRTFEEARQWLRHRL